MRLLISSLLIICMIYKISCRNNSCEKKLDLQGYKVMSITYFKQNIDIGNYDVIGSLMMSAPINEAQKGIVITELQIYNSKKNDTVYITIYGKDFRFFKIADCYYESEIPVIKPFDTDSVWNALRIRYK